MRKLRTILTAILCVTMLLSLAAVASATETRAVVLQCPSCSTGSVYTYTSRAYEHDEYFPCSHGLSGSDIYKVYEVTVRGSCNNCSYSTSDSYEDHVFSYCNGH